MALSKPFFFSHLKTLASKPHQFRLQPQYYPPYFLSLRLLSFATPEDAAAERRRRKRRLRMEPPSNSLRPSQQPQRRPITPISNPNPNAPKLPEHVSVLTGNRLALHNKILKLIRENDLEEASLYTRHSIYSNCRPTVFTCNTVMAALIRQSKYADFLTLHRFITQAGVVPNVVTYNLLINAYCDCRKTDTALEHYRQLINNAPFSPSPTTYRILVKGLVDNGKLEQALPLRDAMIEKGLKPDPAVYNYLMSGLVKNGDSDGALGLFEELKSKIGGTVSDGIVYGNLMKTYFLKGMEKEAMDCYQEAVGENSSIRMSAVAYNSVLDALNKNGKYDEAMELFDKVCCEHNPPMKITVNLGTFNVMVDGFCAQKKFKDAIEVFRSMGDKRCNPDTVSFNNLIEQLCGDSMVAEAEELYNEMGERGIKPDEVTYVLLMDACFSENRADDANGYFGKMLGSELRPNLVVFNKVIDGLIEAGKIDEAKLCFDQMVERFNPDVSCFESMLKTLCEAGKLDEVLKTIDGMLSDESVGLSSEMKEYVSDELRKEGREEELVQLIEEKEREKEEKERQKAEALAKEAEEKAAAANAASARSKFSLNDYLGSSETVSGDGDEEGKEEVAAAEVVEEVTAAEAEALAAEVIEDPIGGGNLADESKTGDEGSVEQVVA
ncbi:hypothetical protein MKW94_018623 [Papaver nudicaule]|uniref:Pentatricopeptide repeat-containing protein n=1 Tax=Papaver nudicaule TaxID=74823 RepID=A0AA41VTD6_PAPNU|nr:hypothetical protein [Papaver nudicaule]